MAMKPLLREIYKDLFETEEQAVETADVQPDDLTAGDLATIEDLKSKINPEIDASIPIVSERYWLTEKLSVGGFEYETTVLNAIAAAGIAGNITKGAGSDKNSPDADFRIGNSVYGAEIKLNSRAQMGGSSLKFQNNKVALTKSIDPEVDLILMSAVKDKSAEIKKMVNFLNKHRPAGVNAKVSGFPLVCTKVAWEKAAQAGMLINAYVKYSTDFIAKHYNSKGIHYIQIGGAGLFYLGSNPANLPIPPLSGEIVIELRSARSGAKPLSNGLLVVAGGIRVQGRLKTTGTSPYSLDNSQSILAMLAAMGNKTTPKKKK